MKIFILESLWEKTQEMIGWGSILGIEKYNKAYDGLIL